MTKKIIIDAQGKKLGRIASDIAASLIGKKDPNFQRHEVADVTVEVLNCAKMDIAEKKARTKVYADYSGYPGGLKKQSLAELSARKGSVEILLRAVSGMIHNNKLKKLVLKNLTIHE